MEDLIFTSTTMTVISMKERRARLKSRQKEYFHPTSMIIYTKDTYRKDIFLFFSTS